MDTSDLQGVALKAFSFGKQLVKQGCVRTEQTVPLARRPPPAVRNARARRRRWHRARSRRGRRRPVVSRRLLRIILPYANP
jgi:hypothetical protein